MGGALALWIVPYVRCRHAFARAAFFARHVGQQQTRFFQRRSPCSSVFTRLLPLGSPIRRGSGGQFREAVRAATRAILSPNLAMP